MSQRQPIHHDLAAEEAFVGCLLCSEGRALDDLPAIQADDLCHSYLAQTVLREMVESHAAGRPIDPVALSQRLTATVHNTPADGGWFVVLSHMLDASGHGASALAGYYHGILLECLAVRRMESLSRWLGTQISGRTDAAALLAETSRRLALVEPQADGGDHALPGVCATILAEIDDQNAGREPRVLRTPLAVWNEAFGGLPAGAYLALGGRPGAGKSSMMEQIIYELIAGETPVLLFEKDMSLKMLVYRLACRACGVPFWKISKGYASRSERDAVRRTVAYFPQTRLRLHNPHGLTADMLASSVAISACTCRMEPWK